MGQLTTLKIKALRVRGLFGDGAGLYLRVGQTGSKAWIQRIVVGGKRRDMGLGGWPEISLQEARAKAVMNRQAIAQGRDPLAERQEEKRQAAVPTFREAAERYYQDNLPRWKPGRHRDRWLKTLSTHAFSVFGEKPVNVIDRADVLKVLTRIWTSTPSQARVLRQKIRLVMGWCQAHGHIEVNPAGEVISAALPSMPTVARHHPALPYQELSKALAIIDHSQAGASTKLCLRFLALTAVRGAEARQATWDEINWETKTWMIPASHMKTRKAHRVPLSSAALEVLEQAKGLDADLIFPGRRGQPLSFITLSALMRRLKIGCVPHGFRSSFRDWAAECTNADYAAMEMSLGHFVGNFVERAYARTDLYQKRQRLMQQWSDYLTGKTQAAVVSIHG